MPSTLASTTTRWIRVGTLIDGVSTQPIRDAHLVYDDTRIHYVDTDAPPRSSVREGQTEPDETIPGHTVLPGLVEAHAHLFLEGGELDQEKRKSYLELPADALLSLATDRLEKIVRLGVLAYRDAGDKRGVGLALSALCKSGKQAVMPYVDSPGAAIHHKGRYGSFMADPIEDHDSAEAVVAQRVQLGADRIKLIPTGIIDFKRAAVTKTPQMSAEEVAEFVAAAKRHGKQTFAHASGDDGIDNAIAGGVDSVEHGFFIRDDQLDRLRDLDIAWVPTFAPVQLQIDEAERMGWDAEIVSNLQRILDSHARSLELAHRKGVSIISGSDAGSYGVAHGLGFLYELELMERAGMPTLSVINAATGAPSRRLAFHEPIGRITPGYKSRFLITEHSPLETVSNLRKPMRIVMGGRILDSLPASEATGL